MRTSTSQFQLLVDYMQKHGDLSKPSDGSHGKELNTRRWAELTQLLNADATGVTKNTDKWRKEEVTELAVLPTLDNDDSPSIFILHDEFAQQTCSNVEDWNRPGTSAQPPVFPPLPVDRNNQDLAGREEPEIVNSPDRSEAGMTQTQEPAARAARMLDRSEAGMTQAQESATRAARMLDRSEAGMTQAQEPATRAARMAAGVAQTRSPKQTSGLSDNPEVVEWTSITKTR
ncbi:uncharacterized protein LOC134669283 [Cydia fagiglandana]|uniref:uncharacterized protein LOC134669283 n=1 Tax=Cydia fagiglandana TaxID=1458189 RepID=UPI002FEDEF0F